MSNRHRMCFGQCRMGPSQLGPAADAETGWRTGMKEGWNLHGA